MYRAQESRLADAVFRDPYARKLAERSRACKSAAAMPFAQRHSWSYTARPAGWSIKSSNVKYSKARTWSLTSLLASTPGRTGCSFQLRFRWIEIDLPDMLNYKQEVLTTERPVCALERVPLDLKDTLRAPCIVSAAWGRSETRGGGKRRAHHLL